MVGLRDPYRNLLLARVIYKRSLALVTATYIRRRSSSVSSSANPLRSIGKISLSRPHTKTTRYSKPFTECIVASVTKLPSFISSVSELKVTLPKYSVSDAPGFCFSNSSTDARNSFTFRFLSSFSSDCS